MARIETQRITHRDGADSIAREEQELRMLGRKEIARKVHRVAREGRKARKKAVWVQVLLGECVR